MLETLLGLRGADEPTRTAADGFGIAALLPFVACRVAAADRARVRKLVGLGVRRPLIEHHAHYLRNDVARALDDDRIALANVLAADFILVVQGRIGDDDTADRHGLEFGDRRQRPRAANLDVDGIEDSRCLLRRELVRDGPARTARNEAESFLIVEAVHLVDHAIDIIAKARAIDADGLIEGDKRFHCPTAIHARIDWQPPLRKRVHDIELRLGRQRGCGTPGIGEEAQRPLGGDTRIELAERTGSRIARIRKHLPTGLGLRRVEPAEILGAEIDLAAHLDHIRYARALELMRDLADRADIGRDVLAFNAIAACGRPDKRATFITDRDGEAVDLRLCREGEWIIGTKGQEAPHALDELGDILVREGIAEREHRHVVADLSERFERRRANTLRRTVGLHEIWKLRLDRREPSAQGVILGIGDGRRVLLVVQRIMTRDLTGKRLVLGRSLATRQLVEGKLLGGFLAHGRQNSHMGGAPASLRTGGTQLPGVLLKPGAHGTGEAARGNLVRRGPADHRRVLGRRPGCRGRRWRRIAGRNVHRPRRLAHGLHGDLFPLLADPGALDGFRLQAVLLEQRVCVTVPSGLRKIMPEHGRGRLRLLLDAKRHVRLREAHERLFDVRCRLMLGDDGLEAIDGRDIVRALEIVAANRHFARGNRVLANADAILGLSGVRALRVTRHERLELGDRLAGCRLIALRILDLVEVRRCNDVMGKRRVLRARMHDDVALRSGYGLGVFPGLVVGIGRQHHRAPRFLRVRVMPIDLLEFLRRGLIAPVGEQSVGLIVHDPGRIGVQRLQRIRIRRRAAGERQTNQNCDNADLMAVPHPGKLRLLHSVVLTVSVRIALRCARARPFHSVQTALQMHRTDSSSTVSHLPATHA